MNRLSKPFDMTSVEEIITMENQVVMLLTAFRVNLVLGW